MDWYESSNVLKTENANLFYLIRRITKHTTAKMFYTFLSNICIYLIIMVNGAYSRNRFDEYANVLVLK